MKNKLRLQRTLKRVLDNKQDITEEIPGLLGTLVKGKERVKVNSRKSFVYVRLHGNQSETVQAFNDTVSILYGLPVLVARVRNKGYNYRVIGKDVGRYQHWGGDTGQALLAPHGLQHSFQPGAGGSDIVWVFKKQFMPLLPYPYTGTSIAVSPDWYQWKESFVYFSGTIIDIGASKPAILGSSRFVTLYLEGSTNNVRGVTGSLFNSSPFPPDVTSYIPKIVPSMGIPLTSVLLSSDTTNVAWNNLYDDYRPIYGFGGDAAYSSGTVSTVGQKLYFTNEEVVVVPTITGSTSLVVTNLASANTDMGGMFGIGSPISTSYDVTLHTCVNNNNDIRYVAAGKWQATLNLIVQHPGYIGGTSGGIYLELWTQDSSTGAETLLSTSDTYSENAPSGWEDYRHTFFGVILSDVSLSATTRIFVRIKYKCPTEIDGEFVYLTLNMGGSYNSTLEFSTSFVFGGGHIIEDDGVILAQRGYLNFVGDMFTAYDDGTATVVSGTANVSLGLTSGSVPFIDGNGKLEEDNDTFFWDNANKRLWIGDITFPFSSIAKLRVINPAGAAGGTFVSYGGTSFLGGAYARGTKASPTAAQSGDGIFWVTATGYDGTTWDSVGTLEWTAIQNWSAGNRGTRLDFKVVASGSASKTTALSLYADTAIIPGTLQTNLGGILNIVSGSSLMIQGGNGDIEFPSVGAKVTVPSSGTLSLTNYGNVGYLDADKGYKVRGLWALAMPTTSSSSIFIGEAGSANPCGIRNFGLGYQSLYNLSTGTQNVAIGYQALYTNVSGGHNTAIGSQALFYCTSSLNVAIGYQALQNVSTLGDCVGIGYTAGSVITVGRRNTFIGNSSNAAANNLSYAIAIGFNARAPASNTCVLGGTGAYAVNVLVGTYTDGMTAGGSVAIQQDLAHRGSKLGFFAKTPIVQPILSSGSTKTSNDIIATLQALGLCKES